MKKYPYLVITIMLVISLSACGKTAATEAPVDAGVPVASAAPVEPGAATEIPANPVDAGTPVVSDGTGGFLFASMPDETEAQVDVRDFINLLREESGISGHYQLVNEVPAGTTWDTVLSYYDGQAKANGWVLGKTEDVTISKGYLCSVALFTRGNNKILVAYYPLNGEIVIVQIEGQ